MNSIRIFIGSVIVYLAVTMIYGCKPSMPHGVGSGGGGGAAMMSSTGSGAGGIGAASSGTAGGKGGGGPVPDADADQSGSRIKAQHFAGADGSKSSHGLYDSLLKTKCVFEPMDDGKFYCVPSAGAYAIDVFADASCAQHLAAVPTSAASCPPSFATMLATPPACSAAPSFFHTYSLGTKFVGTPYQMQGSACVVTTSIPMTDFYSLGPGLPTSMLVSADIVTDP